MKHWFIALVCALTFALPVSAQPAASGTLVAARACPAYQSIAKKTNPNHITLTPGESYAIVAHNKEPATWLLVEIPGRQTIRRWVAVDCGQADSATPVEPQPASTTPATNQGPSTYLLALSWQPTFCEGHKQKNECKAETAQSPEAQKLSLHGLWPQPNGNFYCIADAQQKARMAHLDGDKGQPSQWDKLPDPGMSQATRARLAAVMPGVQSLLERHEWIKHGTCSGLSADAYFNRAADLVEQINASPVGQLLKARAGQSVTKVEILAAFKAGFGDAAPAAVAVTCAGGGGNAEISEIDVYLAGDVTGSDPLSKLVHKADKLGNCSGGRLVMPAS